MNQRGFANIIIISLIAVVVIVSGYFGYKDMKRKQLQATPQQNTESQTPPQQNANQQPLRQETEEDRIWLNKLMEQVTLFPQPGTVVHPGDKIEVRLVLPKNFPTESLKTIFFFTEGFGDNEMRAVEWPGKLAFSWKIPDKLGTLGIHADMITLPLVKTYVVSKPSSPLVSMDVSPSRLDFDYLGAISTFSVEGKYANGETYDISYQDTGTTYTTLSGSDKVIAISKTNLGGKVEPRGDGNDAVLVSNSGQTIAVPAVVKITNHAPEYLRIATTTIKSGEAKTLRVSAFRDPDGDNLKTSFAAVNTADCSQPGEQFYRPISRCLWDRSTYQYNGTVNVINQGNGKILIELKPAPEDFGEFDVIIQAEDDGDPQLGKTARFRVIVVK